MLVFIDESGDPGFKLVQGSSPVFVLAMVLFSSNKQAELASKAIAKARIDYRIKPEFKFNKCHSNAKDGFFDAVYPFDFKVRAIIVDKNVIVSNQLKSTTAKFYNYFTKLLLHHDGGALENARVRIDGCGSRHFKRELGTYLRKELSKGKLHSVKYEDSIKNNLIQLADMASGAIYRASIPDRKSSDKWLKELIKNGKIDDIWNFK